MSDEPSKLGQRAALPHPLRKASGFPAVPTFNRPRLRLGLGLGLVIRALPRKALGWAAKPHYLINERLRLGILCATQSDRYQQSKAHRRAGFGSSTEH